MPSAVESTRMRALLLITILALLTAGLPQAAHASPPTQAPEILAPSPGASSSSNPVLQWGQVSDAVKYRVQVSTSSTFTSLVWSTTSDTYGLSATPPTDLPLGILYWRVAATDGSSGVGPFTESFFEKTIPAAPAPVSPADGDTLTYPSEPPVFSWQPIPDAKTYKLEIDDASDFIGATSYTTNNTSFAPLEPQTVGQDFYWRVQGVTANGINSEWSATRSYTVDWPTVPVPISPPNDTTVPVEDVVFEWDPVAGATSYQLQVSPNGDWANNKTIDVTIPSTRYSHQPTQSLPIFNNGSYFWRVRAKDNKAGTANFGGWSEVWQFTRGWPDKPTLLSPADGDLNVATPSFAWTPVDHASHYEVQLSDDPNFSPGTTFSCYTHHTEFTPYRLDSGSATVLGSCNTVFNTFGIGTFYNWRVRGIDSPGNFNGIWSDPASFIYKTQTPTPLAPANGASVETPVLTWSSVPGISEYKVTIKKASGSVAVTTNTHSTSYTPTVKLAPADGPFKWYVQTVDFEGRLGLSPSEANQFTFTLAAPVGGGSPNPITPSDGAGDPDMPSMTWQPVTGADHYKVLYGVVGSGVENYLSEATKLPFAGFTYAKEPLAVGNYFWYVNAYDVSGALLTSGPTSTFQVTDVGTTNYNSPANCAPAAPCDPIADTPTLSWEATPKTQHYLVYLSYDADFTNIIKVYKTQFTQLTPRESLLDNQAGQAYYWFVRPCKSNTRCGAFDNDVFPTAFAFRKRSAPINPVAPADGATVANQVTLTWEDFLATNSALPQPVTQEAKQYKVQVSTVADFATILDEAIVDQTTYTASTKTYPEGPLYWRVQAIDGSANELTFSPARTLVKQSPQISLTTPANGAQVGGMPYFSWEPQNFAAKYEIEIYKNGDLFWSPTNKVLSDNKGKMAAWAPSTSLAAGTYAWRVRRLDSDSRTGPWSAGRTFTLAPGAPGLVSPVTGADMERNGILFQWNAVQGATAYRIEVSDSPTFEATVESKKTVMTAWAPERKYTDGAYYWRVRTLDAADNPGPASEVRSFSVTTPAPDTTITSGPSGTVESTTATFEFESTAAGATFQCSMDGGTFASCTSPKTYSSLSQGSHTFEVRSIADGVTDPSPASRTFTIETPPPDTTITAGSSGNVKLTSATFEFTSTGASPTFQCSINNGAFSACSSPKTYTALSQGNHRFQVRSISNSITDPSPAEATWTVSSIDITKIVYKAKKLNGEFVQIRNGAERSVSLLGWTLKDASGKKYTFGSFTLPTGGYVKVHTGRGNNSSINLYWGRTKQVWGDVKDTATLKRSDGTEADKCSYNNRSRSSKSC